MEIRDTQSFMYQLTINEPEKKGWTHEQILTVMRENFKTLTYICMADEQGSCYHTHIFVVFASRVRFSMVKRYFEEAHIEKCKGSVSDNVNYVKKTGRWETDESKQEKKIEGTFEEFGTQPPDTKGRRRDLTELYQMVMENMSSMEIVAQNQDYLLILDKIERVRTMILTEKYKDTVRLDLKVIYVSGATGTGKTRGILEKHGYSNVYRVTDYIHPFDSYNCQPVIAFEEFRSSMRISEMLLYCDIYPIELPARYSNKYACYNTIYLVSNWCLEKQYAEVQRDDKESWEAFLRRIHKVVIYLKDGSIKEYDSVEAYFNRDMSETDNNVDVPFE